MPTKKQLKRYGQLLIFCAGMVSLFATALLAWHQEGSNGGLTPTSQPSEALPSFMESKWRYTRYGWQKPGDWIRTSSHVQPRTIDHINPALLAIDVLLAAFGAMIWASEEWQVARLLGRNDP